MCGCECVGDERQLTGDRTKMPLVEEVVHVIIAECKKIQFDGVAKVTVLIN